MDYPNGGVPVVSILVLAYNHERYLGQALDSALMQVTEFSYEIVVGADAGADRTLDIAVEYGRKYPGVIRLLPAHSRLGMHRNFERTITACRGKYMAMLEGDDYWTAPDKLQRQVTLLEQHPEHAICCHKVQVIEESSDRSWYLPYDSQDRKDVSKFEDLLRSSFVPTCSSVVRRELFVSYPEWMHELAMADWPFHLLIAEHGSIAYIDEVMGVYRCHSGGQWSARAAASQLEETVRLFECLKKHFGKRYSSIINERLFEARSSSAVACAIEKDWPVARKHARACILTRPLHRNLYRRCAVAARVYAPAPLFRLAKLVQGCLRRRKIESQSSPGAMSVT